MASTTILRSRRNAAQLQALQQVERDIRATDPHFRRKYLRDFADAYQSYQHVLSDEELREAQSRADILLVGDYHALPSSQRFVSELVRELAASGRQVVLGLEFLYSRDQKILNDWRSGKIGSDELRERTRFDLQWGYDWEPFLGVLETAREHACAVYGLDCPPRDGLRRIGLRDRHAAARIAHIRALHPEAVLVVLFGESHLAPNHLPRLVRRSCPGDCLLTLLQNVDSLYWQAAGEPSDKVGAVQVRDDVICVFNSTPLEKYESYRLCIERWRQEGSNAPDLAPAIYNMISALFRFLNIGEYSPTTGASPALLADELPEVHSCRSEGRTRRMLLRKGADDAEVRTALSHLGESGACYVPRLNAMFVRNFRIASAADQASRFVLHMCGRTRNASYTETSRTDGFYRQVVEESLAYFGSRALYPSRPPVRESDLYDFYSLPAEVIESFGICSHHEFLKMIDFLALHKDYENHCRRYRETPQILTEGVCWRGPRFEFITRWLGQMLGSEIYRAYVDGRLSKRFVRSLFLGKLDKPGVARTTYFVTVRKMRSGRRRTTVCS